MKIIIETGWSMDKHCGVSRLYIEEDPYPKNGEWLPDDEV